MTQRRFPPPWTTDESEACFIVKDRNGQKLAYVYFEDEPGRRSAAHRMTPRPGGSLSTSLRVVTGVGLIAGRIDLHQYGVC
jgi:hypothetical protein